MLRTPHIVLALTAMVSGGALHADLPADLTQLSLEDLLSIQVTSVSKQPETLATAAASVHVLSGEDIRRSGSRSLPEALRLVPGLHVARIDGQRWAISSHGFNGIYADKLEVLIDGRSIYSPLFSGVFWDTQDIFMPDIDRIEVIRGPSAALWGSNAVNGVINIVTRQAAQTQGLLTYAGGGNVQTAFAGLRQGGEIDSRTHWRAYAKHWQRAAQRTESGADAEDGLQSLQAGLRLERRLNASERLLLSGDGYTTRTEQPAGGANPEGRDDDQNGAHLLARWSRSRSAESELTAQFFWDHTERTQTGVFGEKRDTWDLQIQQRLDWNHRHQLTLGAGYRISKDEQSNSPLVIFTPDARTINNANVFISHRYQASDATALILGARLENNEFTGFDSQPSLKLSHRINDRVFAWFASSRALRLPTRLDNDVLVPIPDFGIQGNRDFQPESLLANELGLRWALSPALSFDLSGFYNQYGNLRGTEPLAAPEIPLIVNNHEADSAGFDLSARWEASAQLRLHFAYSYLDLDLKPKGDTADTQTERAEGLAPRHQLWLRGHWQAGPRWSLAAHLRHVDGLPAAQVPAFTDLGLRLAWQFRPRLEIALTGENLLDGQRREWELDSEVERGVYLEFSWRPE